MNKVKTMTLEQLAAQKKKENEVLMTELFGERCPEFDKNCAECIAWAAWDLLIIDRQFLERIKAEAIA